MRINPINCFSVQKNQISKKVNNSPETEGISSDSVSFKADYYSVYKSALNKNFDSYSAVERTFLELLNSAKRQHGGLYRASEIFSSGSLKSLLKKIQDSYRYNGASLETSRYPSPLATIEDEAIAFHHPEYGEFGNGNITFYLDGDEVCVSRPRDFHKFYNNNRLKESYDKIEGGGITNKKFYNKDGSESFWRNLIGI